MSTTLGYTQGSIVTFGHRYENAVYPVAVEIVGTDGSAVHCTQWLPLGKSFAPQSVYMDVAFGRRRRVYRPAADAQDGTPRPVALELDYASGVLTVTSVDGVSVRSEGGDYLGVIA